jgi:hypothetical protein
VEDPRSCEPEVCLLILIDSALGLTYSSSRWECAKDWKAENPIGRLKDFEEYWNSIQSDKKLTEVRSVSFEFYCLISFLPHLSFIDIELAVALRYVFPNSLGIPYSRIHRMHRTYLTRLRLWIEMRWIALGLRLYIRLQARSPARGSRYRTLIVHPSL